MVWASVVWADMVWAGVLGVATPTVDPASAEDDSAAVVTAAAAPEIDVAAAPTVADDFDVDPEEVRVSGDACPVAGAGVIDPTRPSVAADGAAHPAAIHITTATIPTRSMTTRFTDPTSVSTQVGRGSCVPRLHDRTVVRGFATRCVQECHLGPSQAVA